MAKRELNVRQRKFVQAYATNGGNGTAAARAAGYKGTDNVLGVTAHDLLRNPKIEAALSALTGKALARSERGAIADLAECLEFLTMVKRSRLGDYLGDDGEASVARLRAAPEGLIKKIRIKSTTDEDGQVYAQHEIETESALAAVQTLVKHYGEQEGTRVQGALAHALQALPAEVVTAIARGMLSGNGHGRAAIDVKATVVR